MNIQLQFEGASAHEIRREMREFLGLDREGAAPSQPTAEPEPKVTRGKSKASSAAATSQATPSSAAAESAEGNATAENAGPSSGASSTTTATSATTSPSETPSREDIAKKAVLYGQPGKGGPVALKQLLSEHGAPNSKWSEVPDEQLPGLNARLDELLA